MAQPTSASRNACVLDEKIISKGLRNRPGIWGTVIRNRSSSDSRNVFSRSPRAASYSIGMADLVICPDRFLSHFLDGMAVLWWSFGTVPTIVQSIHEVT